MQSQKSGGAQQNVYGANAGRVSPLSNSFRHHCIGVWARSPAIAEWKTSNYCTDSTVNVAGSGIWLATFVMEQFICICPTIKVGVWRKTGGDGCALRQRYKTDNVCHLPASQLFPFLAWYHSGFPHFDMTLWDYTATPVLLKPKFWTHGIMPYPAPWNSYRWSPNVDNRDADKYYGWQYYVHRILGCRRAHHMCSVTAYCTAFQLRWFTMFCWMLGWLLCAWVLHHWEKAF